MNELLTNIGVSMTKGDLPGTVAQCEQAVAEGAGASEILDSLLTAMGALGVRFKNNEVFVPEVLIAARAMNGGLEVIKPLLASEGVKSIGKIVIGTVKGDLHDIGKNLVRMMLVGAGFEVIDVGVDCSAEKYIEALVENEADILCMSALLTTTMVNMKTIIEKLEEQGIRDKYKVMIGGAPVTQDYADEIGADRYSPDAATAAEVAKLLICA